MSSPFRTVGIIIVEEQYREYHRKVVDACAALMGEQHSEFFDTECSYEENFIRGDSPEEVAQNEYDALT